MLVVVDKGTNDGISVGTAAYIRLHKAAMASFEVSEVSDETSTVRGWQYDTVRPGDTIIFNIARLSDDELLNISDRLSGSSSSGAAGHAQPSPSQDEFVGFMSRFYVVYGASNWPEMRSLAGDPGRASDCFGKLVGAAESIAKPGLESATTDWSHGDSLAPDDLVRIALSVVAASQGKQDPGNANLTLAQRKAVIDVWGELYGTALREVGGPGAALPTDTTEPKDKLERSSRVAQAIGEPALEALSINGQAWLAERVGDTALAGRLRKRASTLGKGYVSQLPWPPVDESGAVKLSQ
jgi:hypothetical protein